MNVSWLTQVLTGLGVALISGIAGAAYQLHRRRSRPFVLVTDFWGSSLQLNEEVDVPRPICDRLNEASYLGELHDRSTLREVSAVLKEAIDLGKRGQSLLSLLERAVAALDHATDDASITRALIPPLEKKIFDQFIMLALSRGRLRLSSCPVSASAKIVTYEMDLRGGCFVLALPGRPVEIGEQLNKVPLFRDQLMPFIEAVKTLDRNALRDDFRSLADLLGIEIQIADGVRRQLEEITQNYSRWEAYIYLANYGETGMLVLPQATLQVKKSKFERPVQELCKMVIYGEEGDKEFKKEEKSGLLIPPNGQKKFTFVTTNTQMQMPAGNEFRGRFKDGVSKARIRFHCVSAGIPSKKTVRTSWGPFKD